MPTSTLTSKGQVTIPKPIRERFSLETGDRLEFTVDEAGHIVVRPRSDQSGVCGILSDLAPRRPVTVAEMKRAIRRRAAQQGRRAR